MAKAGAGSIVLISSVAAHQAWAQEAVYSATKAATSSLVQGFAVDLAPFGIRVNAVAPGPVEHKAQTMATTRADPEVYRHEIERTPFAKLGSPEDVAETVWLLSKAPWVTGQTLYADGGFLATGLGYFGKAREALLSDV
jgi:NAD(P)-dependent dehydrogenase (short-subunit alcohol dehydrogenase family)